jgi:glycosyltransferase involved in cell wall biosynthesis
VQFLGRQDDLEHFLPGCDLFLLPSESESFGLAALEAMACGVPAVGTRVGGLPEVIRPGVDGELCTPGDADGLGATCVDLLRDPAQHARMQAAARARAVEQFALETIAPLYEQLYYEVAAGG